MILKRLTNLSKKFILIEFIAGLCSGELGVYIFSFRQNHFDINSSIIYAFAVMLGSMFIGIWITGFFHIKKIGKLNSFGLSMFYTVIGSIVFLILYIILDILSFNIIPYFVSTVILPVFMTLSGAVIGFNYPTLEVNAENN